MTEIQMVMSQAPVWRPAPDCHLYLWATNRFLPDALELMRWLGFRYVTNVAWVKQRNAKLQTGLGQYFRGSHELLLFGTRGVTRKPNKALPSVIIAERTKHSRKPDASLALAQSTSPGPYLEMFARETRPGWVCWGDEIEGGR